MVAKLPHGETNSCLWPQATLANAEAGWERHLLCKRPDLVLAISVPLVCEQAKRVYYGAVFKIKGKFRPNRFDKEVRKGHVCTGMRRPSRHFFCILCLIACGMAANVSCSRPPKPVSMKILRSRYVRQAGYPAVVVFVHGVFGDAESTWTNLSSKSYWPDLLTKDDAFRKADIYVYSYNSPLLHRAYSVDDIVEDMHSEFEAGHVFDSHADVVFVCHSMGGIIVRSYLTRYQQDAEKVSLVYFFATPTDGAHIATMARLLSANPQLGGLLPVTTNDYLHAMQRNWRALVMHIKILSRCAFETEDTYHIRIVDEQSASSLCDGTVTPIPADHISIVKPEDTGNRSYVAFLHAFLEKPQPPGTPMVFEFVAPEGIHPGQRVRLVVQSGESLKSTLVPEPVPRAVSNSEQDERTGTSSSRQVAKMKAEPRPKAPAAEETPITESVSNGRKTSKDTATDLVKTEKSGVLVTSKTPSKVGSP